ncbi:MAG: hypothetical protein QOK08_1099, partial [Actinomycetota bacterium]|nr:hypothetical protein [Actinomycetota bacterium]
ADLDLAGFAAGRKDFAGFGQSKVYGWHRFSLGV